MDKDVAGVGLDTNNDKQRFNKNYKDGVFRLLFQEPEKAAELYYALTERRCDPADIRIITLQDAVSTNFKNDLAMVVDDEVLIVCEHQSTINENMPLRMLLYCVRLYEIYLKLENDKRFLYAKKLYKIPKPEFVVLYNGDEEMEPVRRLKLSNAYLMPEGKTEHLGSLELEVPVYNINKNQNPEIVKRSSFLEQYTEFIAIIKRSKTGSADLAKAIELAIDECRKRGILTEFLIKHGGDVMSIFNTEWNFDDCLEVACEEAREQGLERGLERGLEQGLERGRYETVKIAKLFFERKTPDEIAGTLNIPRKIVDDVIMEFRT